MHNNRLEANLRWTYDWSRWLWNIERIMISLSLDLPLEISADEVRLLLAIKLFEEHLVTLGKATELAGCSKQDFMAALSKHGVAIFDYPQGALERELLL